MRSVAWWIVGLASLLVGCSSPAAFSPPVTNAVTPSATGSPNSVLAFGGFEYVSVQGAGQIFIYRIANGEQVPAAAPYTTPCADPSGMAVANIAGSNVMAVACYDTNSLLTLAVAADGSLAPLGSIGGLPSPFPGIVLDGTNVYVPLFGSASSNGAVAKVSLASPAHPVVIATAALATPVAGGVANAEYIAAQAGFLYVTSGSESNPLNASSTIQVVDAATMSLMGAPLVVPHSPQQIAVLGTVAFVTLYDSTQIESIDISNPANPQPLQILSLAVNGHACHALPVAVRDATAYVGCYDEAVIVRLDVSNPSQMKPSGTLSGIASPQRLAFSGDILLAAGSNSGGALYRIDPAEF